MASRVSPVVIGLQRSQRRALQRENVRNGVISCFAGVFLSSKTASRLTARHNFNRMGIWLLESSVDFEE